MFGSFQVRELKLALKFRKRINELFSSRMSAVIFLTFANMKFSSQLIENAVDAFASLPGIGRKSALRLVLHLLNKDQSDVEDFVNKIGDVRKHIKSCVKCHNLSDKDICTICEDVHRNQTSVCVVENIRDVLAIENTGQFRGVYHVLGGVIRPIEGIGPEQLNIDSLLERISKDGIKELILAISPTIEGDTTMFYISKQLEGKEVNVTTIARGVSFGGELQYADELTLGRSIMSRVPYRTS